MALSEIEKLERRYQENPQGLTFAPLAEAYRKSGDAQRALAVLGPGLELHPDYIPASIVLGRCHLDLKDDAAAELAFGHVLSLDTENVIALKALADITERGARFGDSANWLEQLLVVDRSNEEARVQLARVREGHAQQAATGVDASAPGALEAREETLEVEQVAGFEQTAVGSGEITDFGEDLPPLETVERETSGATASEAPVLEAFEPTVVAAPEPPPPMPPFPPMPDPTAGVLDDALLGVMQLGSTDEIVLHAADSSEFQIASASDAFTAVSETSGSASSEYQLPSASDDLGAVPSADAASGGSEYQLPSASDELVPEAEAAVGASEFQLPDASSDFGGSALTPVNSNATSNEYQSTDNSFQASTERNDVVPPAVAAVFEADPGPEPEPGEWATWSDAALDADAEPFEEDAPVASLISPEPVVAAIPDVVVPHEAAVESAMPEAAAVEEDVIPTEEMALDDAGTEEPGAPMDSDLVVTESMAELFLTQGHPADALRIFRELLARRPDDDRLATRVAGLESQESAQAAPLPRYAASASGGTSVRELMRTVLGSRPATPESPGVPAAEATTAAESPGSPTRPAGDHLTLSAIFGDDASPVAPVVRSARAPRPATTDRGGVSFDEFYGASGQRTSAPRPAGAAPDGGSEDDLDQFHDWLQNLKR
jgi:hypothetical protein